MSAALLVKVFSPQVSYCTTIHYCCFQLKIDEETFLKILAVCVALRCSRILEMSPDSMYARRSNRRLYPISSVIGSVRRARNPNTWLLLELHCYEVLINGLTMTTFLYSQNPSF